MEQPQQQQQQQQQQPQRGQSQQVLEARIDALATYLRFSIFKVQAFRYTVLHTIFFLLVSLLAFVSLDGRISSAVRDNAEVLLSKTAVEESATASDVADWFAGVLPTLGTLQSPTAESLVILAPFAETTYRVHRSVEASVCDEDAQLGLLQRSEQQRLSTLCSSVFAAFPEGAGTEFTFPWPMTGPALAAQTQTFTDTVLRDDTADIEVTSPLYLHASSAITLVEVKYSALAGTTSFRVSAPGAMHLSQTEARLFVALAAVAAALTVAVVVEIVADAKLEMSVSEKTLNVFSLKLFIEVLLLLTTLAWLAVVVWLLVIWNSPGPGGLSTGAEATALLKQSAEGYLAARNIFAAWYSLLFFRSFFYLRFWSRLSVLSDTVVSSAPALIGCSLTLLALVVAFAAVGNVLYGHLTTDGDFRTLPTAIVFVFIFLYRGGAIAYEPYIDQEAVSATVFFLLLHFWVQIIVLNVIIGVVASAFSAVVTSVDLVRAVSWDPASLMRDWRHFLRRFRTTDDGGDLPIAAVSTAGATDVGSVFVSSRLPLLRHVQRRLRREPGSTTVTAGELMMYAEMPGFTAAQRRLVVDRALYKASKHVGNADGVDRGFKMSLQDSKRTNAMEADFWRQARIIQDLYSSVCGATGGTAASPQLQAEAEAVSAAEEDLQRSADLLHEDRQALERAIAGARGETGELADELDDGSPRLSVLGTAAAGFRESLDSIRTAVERAEINRRPVGQSKSEATPRSADAAKPVSNME